MYIYIYIYIYAAARPKILDQKPFRQQFNKIYLANTYPKKNIN